jgi:hypothetical protein
MKITITRAAFDTALHIEGKSFWLSQQLKAVQLALTNYALDRDNPALEPAARNNLNFAIYTWKQQKPTEFEKYDNVGGGVVRKLVVQTGLDDYQPAPSASVLLRGTLRVTPTERAEPVVTPLSSDLASLLVEYAAGGRKVAVLVIDLAGHLTAERTEPSKKCLAFLSNPLFELTGTIAVGAGPRLRAV